MEHDKIEQLILKALASPSRPTDGQIFVEILDGLTETEATLRMRETVYHIDRLMERGLVALKADANQQQEQDSVLGQSTQRSEGGYTDEHGNISITYLNSAVALYPDKLEVTEAGLRQVSRVRGMGLSLVGNTGGRLSERPWFIVLTYAVTFLMGMATMAVLMSLF